MRPDQWERVAELYQSACDLPLERRGEFLASACAGDAQLLAEVESLLAQDVTRDGVIERVARVGFFASTPLPAAVGGYRILRLLGEGGMGVVYEAEQEHPRRRVALKIVKSQIATPELLRRFEVEAQSLARLQHPGIAHVYDSGVANTDFGPRPYFVMELIRGGPLPAYLLEHGLSARERIELVARICDAVEHAHVRGVIHRDLKPANILVNEAGQPKIVDFGVARITDADGETTRQTSAGELIGTLAYMSPEQVAGSPGGVDAASDVYSLGVVLYELLSARLPYLTSVRLEDSMRAIREEAPEPLEVEGKRADRDLETVVGKAMAKDAGRRYESASALAADLRRYLANEPILARPPSMLYQAGKFAARNKGMAVSMVAVLGALATGAALSTYQAIRAVQAERIALEERDRAAEAEKAANGERNRAVQAERSAFSERAAAEQERNRADSEAASARAISEFLQDALRQADPSVQTNPNLTVRAALDRASAKLEGRFKAQPGVEGAIRYTLGKTYRNLGATEQAAEQLRKSISLRQRASGAESIDTVQSTNELALVYLNQYKFAEAEALISEVLAIQKKHGRNADAETLSGLTELAVITGTKRGDHHHAAELLQTVLDGARRLWGPAHPETLAALNNRASELVNLGLYGQAEELYLEAIAIKRRVLGSENSSTLLSVNSLGVAYRYDGKFREAEPLLKQTLETRRRLLGEDNRETLASMISLGNLYLAERDYRRAEPLLTDALERALRVHGTDHYATTTAMNSLGDLFVRDSKPVEAEAMLRKVLAVRRRRLSAGNDSITRVLTSLAELKMAQCAYEEAEALLREALDGQRKAGTAATWRTAFAESLLGVALAGLNRDAEAEALLVSGAVGLEKQRAAIPFENREIVATARSSLEAFRRGLAGRVR